MSRHRDILLCPDSFKGSLTAEDVATAMARGVHVADPQTQIRALPMADGGEGSAELVTQTLGWEWHLSDVHGPTGTHLTAGWGYDPERRRAVIDVASACGLDLVRSGHRNPWQLDSRGVGELIRSALDAGAMHLLIGLGGSATVDGGAGMLQALGVRFLDHADAPLPTRPGGLVGLERVDFSGLDPRLRDVEITVLNDVDNPLTGEHGAARVFGPQKGLAAEDIETMDAHLGRLAELIDASGHLQRAPDTPGAGAAGGLGFALACVLEGEARMGAAYLADLIGLDAAIAAADLVITGEGQIDSQTSRGKVVAEVVARARRQGVPVLAVAGSISASVEELAEFGLADARALVEGDVTVEQAMAEPSSWIAVRTQALLEDYLGS